MTQNEILWIVAIVIFSVVEIVTTGLVSIWFAGGALIALFAAMLGFSTGVQIFVFIAVSAVLIILLRKYAVGLAKKKTGKTNLDRIIGQDIILTQTINPQNNSGKAMINDVEWKVKSQTGEIIEEGTLCSVVDIEGVRLVVIRK